ncbi:MAG TPA: hypothetical protein DCM28_19485 [Phycisphaerales bacterium]|nr:hypothetical protein [Phycisphaerales bacterium]|tara:strand:+ start:1264 stop:1944 length:681 start_codon:yes stop_codon:yes gene_type:complete
MTDVKRQADTSAKRRKPSMVRLVGLTVLSISLLGLTWLIVHKRLPKPAPQDVQDSGMVIIRQITATVANSTWGGTQRAQELLKTIDSAMQDNRIVFTNDIDDSGLTVRGTKGKKCIYIKVVISDSGDFQHHPPGLLCDVLFHEALHAWTIEPNCIEQECDAFVAGMDAVCVFENRMRPKIFHVEGRPIGNFVIDKYPELKRNPDYKPMALDTDWLVAQTGLPSITQ